MSTIELRRARPEDVEDIEAVARMTWADTYDGLIPHEAQAEHLDQSYSPEALLPAIEHPDRWFFVACHLGEVIGFADFGPVDDRTVELFRMYVDPGAQRLGVGSELLEAGLDAARSSGRPYSKILLYVEDGNVKGQRFYSKHGFSSRPTAAIEVADAVCSAQIFERAIGEDG
jgi:ribosomal protein S18 acetylase RimI-like enzyme